MKLAAWMTDPANPWFARLACNRLWKHFFARGFVEPEDDLRSTNPATNEPLLSYLAERLVSERFDLKSLMRLILNSRVYQLSSLPNATNADDDQNFSHHYAGRLPAEVMLDAIGDVTGVAETFPGCRPGTAPSSCGITACRPIFSKSLAVPRAPARASADVRANRR